jgi:DNA-binding HxlR family transcriptional regulator
MSSTGVSGHAFENDDERRALLLRMGTGSTAWAYGDTLARAARLPRNALEAKLELLEREGLVTSKRVPAGVKYLLTEEGRRLRASS